MRDPRDHVIATRSRIPILPQNYGTRQVEYKPTRLEAWRTRSMKMSRGSRTSSRRNQKLERGWLSLSTWVRLYRIGSDDRVGVVDHPFRVGQWLVHNTYTFTASGYEG